MAQSEDYRKMEAFIAELLEQRRRAVSYWFTHRDTGEGNLMKAAREVQELTALLEAARATLGEERQVDIGSMMA